MFCFVFLPIAEADLFRQRTELLRRPRDVQYVLAGHHVRLELGGALGPVALVGGGCGQRLPLQLFPVVEVVREQGLLFGTRAIRSMVYVGLVDGRLGSLVAVYRVGVGQAAGPTHGGHLRIVAAREQLLFYSCPDFRIYERKSSNSKIIVDNLKRNKQLHICTTIRTNLADQVNLSRALLAKNSVHVNNTLS